MTTAKLQLQTKFDPCPTNPTHPINTLFVAHDGPGSCNDTERPLRQHRVTVVLGSFALCSSEANVSEQAVKLSGGEAETYVSASPGLAAQSSGPQNRRKKIF